MESRTPTKRRVSVTVAVDYLLSHLGFFTLLPVLPILIDRFHPQAAPWFVGLALFLFNFAVRGASLFCAGILHRTRIRDGVSSGLLLAALGFLLLPFSPDSSLTLVFLVVAGTGVSVNGLMARVYITASVPGSGSRNRMFSLVQIVVNVAAALGPIAANLLVEQHAVQVMVLISCLYATAGVAVYSIIPGELQAGQDGVRPPLRLGLLKTVVVVRHIREIAVLSATGHFLYGQLFSAIALHIFRLGESAPLRSSFFVLNAILVIVIQIPVSKHVSRSLEHGKSTKIFLTTGLAVFGASFVSLGIFPDSVLSTFVAIAVFSLGETIFTPMVSTAFSQLDDERPAVELFNMRQVAVATGESIGSFSGGALFLAFFAWGGNSFYWWMLALTGILVAGSNHLLSVSKERTKRNTTKTTPSRSGKGL